VDKIILHEHCSCTKENLEQMKLLGGLIDIVQEIHKMMSSADMRSRLAFGNAVEANEKMEKLVEKNKKDFEFLMTPYQSNKFKNNKNNWTGGIDV